MSITADVISVVHRAVLLRLATAKYCFKQLLDTAETAITHSSSIVIIMCW